MRGLEFWRTVVADETNLLEDFLKLLEQHGIPAAPRSTAAVDAR